MKYAIIGNPVEHSLSPKIHAHLAKTFGIDLEVHSENVETEREFYEALTKYDVMNITFPFKKTLKDNQYNKIPSDIPYANVLVNMDGELYGSNTDGVGFARSIAELPGKYALVLGSGMTSSAICKALSVLGYRVTVISRKPPVDNEPFKRCDCYRPEKFNPDKKKFDMVINATDVGFKDNNIPFAEIMSKLTKIPLWIDVIYGKETAFLKYAKEHGCKAQDGTEFLKWQAAYSFREFTNHDISPAVLKNAIDLMPDV